MSLWWIIVPAVLLLLFTSLIPAVKHWRFRRSIRNRASKQPEWEVAFPDSMPIVESVLTMLCDAFLFDRRDRFQFAPDDVLSFIYKKTTGPWGDTLELERLSMDLREEFGVELPSFHSPQTTLRDVVAIAQEQPRSH